MTFDPVYARDSDGIGGYDLQDPRESAFAFDYNHSGRLDHIAIYRPGHGIFFFFPSLSITTMASLLYSTQASELEVMT